MNYQVGQQNYTGGDANSFADSLTNGESKVITSSNDKEVSGTIGFSFDNPWLDLSEDGGLQPTNSYYFHAKILRLTTPQSFYIRLIRVENNEITLKQYIKKIEIKERGDGAPQNIDTDFIDVECIFTPLENFDGIMLELQRTSDDLIMDPDHPGTVTGRVPVVGYLEVSIIKNKIPQSELAKIGVQSRPGLMMCINKEEIHVPGSGIFELRDGIVRINFFSVVSGQTPDGTQLTDQMETPYSEIASACFLGESKTREISKFTLDYLYQS